MLEIFKVSDFTFSNEKFEQTIIVNQGMEGKVVEFQTRESSKRESEFTYVPSISAKEIIDLGEQIAKVIKSSEKGVNLEINGLINKTLLLESILLALTDINIYRIDYQKAKSYKINCSSNVQEDYNIAKKNANAYHLARMLNHLPYDVCNTESLAQNISTLLADERFEIEIMRQKECEELNLVGMLTLAKASKYEPAFIKIKFKNGGKSKIGLVGKGIMFDTGGYNLKSGDFGSMKTDMAGSGAVIGTMKNLAELDVKCDVCAYIMASDNFINEHAYIPASVLKYPNNITVEIGNTDAEGRLVLADGLILASNDKCDTIIDIATLTGNAAVALGKEYAPMYCTNDQLRDIFIKNNQSNTDKVWPMPLAQEYKHLLKGNISDLRNVSSTKHAGSIMAALFLEHFVDENANWIHIDMGAMSRKEEYNTPSNAYGVRLLTSFIQEYENK